MDSEIARWRIAYDTISALVSAADQSRTGVALRAHGANDVTAAGGGHGPLAQLSSHQMIQGQLRPQQQQRRDGDVAQLTQSSMSTAVFQSPYNHHTRNGRSPPAMTAHCGGGDEVATRLTRDDGETIVSLYRRLLDRFYLETTLWLYTGVLLHPAARRTRRRLHWLGVVTGRGLEQATGNVLSGFVAGYRQSRRALDDHVEEALRTGGAGRLADLAVELGVVLNPRQMMRSLSAVVRDLVLRTSSLASTSTASPPPTPVSRLYRYVTV